MAGLPLGLPTGRLSRGGSWAAATAAGGTPSGTATPLLSGRSGGAAVPLLPGRIVDQRRRHKVIVERHFQGRSYRGLSLYYLTDLFHTLVNCPWYRFYLLFVTFYCTMYAAFAAYYSCFPGCITKVTTFYHALWFSVATSATIGYGHQAPDPDCVALQLGVTAQVLVSLLMQASLLGLVFARISNSSGRSATIRFSKVLSFYRGADGLWRLAFRLANLRQHQVLQPEVRVLLLRRAASASHAFSTAGAGAPEYMYSELACEHMGGGRLWLGVPSIIEHRIDAASPLYGISEEDMREMDLEFIVLLDGIDESTSRAIEARHSYVPADIRWQHHFDPCIQRQRSGRLGVDFALFDTTQADGEGSGEAADGAADGAAADGMAAAAADGRAGGPPNLTRRSPFASPSPGHGGPPRSPHGRSPSPPV